MSDRDRCYQCGHDNDDATDAYGNQPKPKAGSIAVCLYCAAPGIFTGNGYEVRAPSDAERAELLESPAVIDVIAVVRLEGPNS